MASTYLTLTQMHKALRMTNHLTLDSFFNAGNTMAGLNDAYIDARDAELEREYDAEQDYPGDELEHEPDRGETWDDFYPWSDSDYGVSHISHH